MRRIPFSGYELSLGEKSVVMEYPILDAFEIEDKAIVLLDPRQYHEKNTSGGFRNLIALRSDDGQHLWTAEVGEGGAYYRVKREKPLLAYAPSYRYEIDIDTGRILSEEFLK